MQNRLAHRMRCLSPLARLALTALMLFAVVAVIFVGNGPLARSARTPLT